MINPWRAAGYNNSILHNSRPGLKIPLTSQPRKPGYQARKSGLMAGD